MDFSQAAAPALILSLHTTLPHPPQHACHDLHGVSSLFTIKLSRRENSIQRRGLGFWCASVLLFFIHSIHSFTHSLHFILSFFAFTHIQCCSEGRKGRWRGPGREGPAMCQPGWLSTSQTLLWMIVLLPKLLLHPPPLLLPMTILLPLLHTNLTIPHLPPLLQMIRYLIHTLLHTLTHTSTTLPQHNTLTSLPCYHTHIYASD